MAKNGNSIRILSGIYKNRELATPGGKTHPMGSREKLALMNTLQPYLEEAVVLDMYAGSGALGLEALSRGAKEVVFVENNAKARKVIEENVKNVGDEDIKLLFEGLAQRGSASQSATRPWRPPLGTRKAEGLRAESTRPEKRVLCLPSLSPLTNSSFDIIIADPPYDDFHPEELQSLIPLLKPDGILALSHPSSFDPESLEGIELQKTKQYAACNLSFYQK